MIKNHIVATGLLASSCLAAMQANGVENGGSIKDAWIDGQLEAVSTRSTGYVKGVRYRLVVAH